MIKRRLSLLPSDEIVTAEPLAELIDYAIKHTQQGGDMQSKKPPARENTPNKKAVRRFTITGGLLTF